MGFNWLDAAVIIILLIGVLNGMAKGFILSVFNIAGMIVSLILARYLTPTVSDFVIENTSLDESLHNLFIQRMSSMNSSTLQLIKFFTNGKVNIEETLTLIFINIAIFICLFMIATVILNLLRDSIKFTVRKTPLRYLDITGGLIIGLVKSAIIIYMIFALLTPLMGVLPQKEIIIKAIDSSLFAKYFYYYNFILSWFEKMYNA